MNAFSSYENYDAYEAYNLACRIGPSEQLADIIATDAYNSYCYARCILKCPFPAGELAIAKDESLSYLYARYVLKAPFLLGEIGMIYRSHIEALDYQFRFKRYIYPIQKVAKYPAYSLAYAIMIGGRFPEGEPAMERSPRIWKRYQEFLNESS